MTIDDFAQWAAAMRAAGVTELSAVDYQQHAFTIRLAPPAPAVPEPPKPMTAEQKEAAKKQARRAKLQTMLGASAVRFTEEQLDELAGNSE
jgi:hypothetical protein